MRRLLIILLLAAAGPFLSARGELLLWMVTSDDPVIDFRNPSVKAINDLVSGPAGHVVNGVRIRVGDESSSDYLPMMIDTGSGYELGGTIAVWDRDYEEAGPAWADLSGHAGKTFTIELGYFDEEENWTRMAFGETTAYEMLREFTSSSIVDNPGFVPWTSSYVAVPEPSSGLLLVIGGALLALRRRTRQSPVETEGRNA